MSYVKGQQKQMATEHGALSIAHVVPHDGVQQISDP